MNHVPLALPDRDSTFPLLAWGAALLTLFGDRSIGEDADSDSPRLLPELARSLHSSSFVELDSHKQRRLSVVQSFGAGPMVPPITNSAG